MKPDDDFFLVKGMSALCLETWHFHFPQCRLLTSLRKIKSIFERRTASECQPNERMGSHWFGADGNVCFLVRETRNRMSGGDGAAAHERPMPAPSLSCPHVRQQKTRSPQHELCPSVNQPVQAPASPVHRPVLVQLPLLQCGLLTATAESVAADERGRENHESAAGETGSRPQPLFGP